MRDVFHYEKWEFYCIKEANNKPMQTDNPLRVLPLIGGVRQKIKRQSIRIFFEHV